MSEGLSATANGNAAAGHQFSQLQVTSKFSWIEILLISIKDKNAHTKYYTYIEKGKKDICNTVLPEVRRI